MRRERFFYVIVIVIIIGTIFYIMDMSLFEIFKNIIWAVASFMIIENGLFFSFKTKFKQFNFKKMFKVLKSKDKDLGINTISSLAMSLAGRIGVGSLAGVALAIFLGGIGSIFWMWVISLIAVSNTYAEGVLGVIYKTKDTLFVNRGGPYNYIKNGLNFPKLATLYALFLIVCYIGGFLTIQTNTIVKVTSDLVFLNPIITVIIVGVIMGLVILGGTKKIAKFNLGLVSLMGVVFLGFGIFVILKNITLIPSIIINIVRDAFNFKSFLGGFIYTLVVGFQRGIFASEAGLGTSSVSAAMTNDNEEVQGMTQMLGIYITTLVVCTITAFIIILSDYNTLVLNDINGIEITKYAFSYHSGDIGSYLLMIIVILFSYSTIISGYYYGESSLKFLVPNIKDKHLKTFKIICVLITMLGGVVSSTSLWSFVDISVAFLIIINVYSLRCLYKDVIY